MKEVLLEITRPFRKMDLKSFAKKVAGSQMLTCAAVLTLCIVVVSGVRLTRSLLWKETLHDMLVSLRSATLKNNDMMNLRLKPLQCHGNWILTAADDDGMYKYLKTLFEDIDLSFCL